MREDSAIDPQPPADVSHADEPIRLVPYDPTWPAQFEAERTAISEAIGKWIVGGIHHVGSTAVLGLEAKPIIDLHLVPAGAKRYVDELIFRDRLQSDPTVAEEYLALKRTLASRLANDREVYTNAKSAFIHRALE